MSTKPHLRKRLGLWEVSGVPPYTRGTTNPAPWYYARNWCIGQNYGASK